MTAIDCEYMQLPHEERTHRCGGSRVFKETREANQQGAAQASSHLWLGCLTFAWDDGAGVVRSRRRAHFASSCVPENNEAGKNVWPVATH
jgi:hypothetical protein